MTRIDTVDQLDALPIGSVCVDPYDEKGDAPVVICKNARGLWQALASCVSDTRREDVERVLMEHRPHMFSCTCGWETTGTTAGVCAQQWRAHQADAVLAVLPAPPAVDEATIRDLARAERHRLHDEENFFAWSSQSDAHDDGYVAGYIAAARLRGATRG